MNRTKIEWVKNPDGSQGYTWNPVTGCLNNCEYCYARKLAHGRLKQRYLANNNIAMKPLGLEGALGYRYDQADFKDPFYPRFWEERMACQFSYSGKAQGIFVCDMGDLFGIGVPDNWTWQVLQLIKAYPQHRFYLLTKQPQNLIKFSPFPENCWVGVTATSDIMFRIAVNDLRRIVAKVKYISFEPLLDWQTPEWDTLSSNWLRGINWLIIGACTSQDHWELEAFNYHHDSKLQLRKWGKRWTLQPRIEWVREIAEAADKAGVRVFLKDNIAPLCHGLNEPFWTDNGTRLRQEMPE